MLQTRLTEVSMRTLLAPILLPIRLFQNDWWSDPQTRWLCILYSTGMGMAVLFLLLLLISMIPVKDPFPTPPQDPATKTLASYAKILREGLEGSVGDTGIGWGGQAKLRSIHKHYIMRAGDPRQITIEFPGPKGIGGHWRAKSVVFTIHENTCPASPVDEKPDWGGTIEDTPSRGIYRMSAKLCALPTDPYVEVPITAKMEIEFPRLAPNGIDFLND